MSTLRLLLSDSTDPRFNLAVEECIFRQMPATQRVLFLWRNADTVVIGRAQNPWKECNTRRMEEDNVRWPAAAAAAAPFFTIWATPALPLWRASPSTIKPSPPGLCWLRWRRWASRLKPPGAMTRSSKQPKAIVKSPAQPIAKPLIAVFTTARCC